MIKRIALSLLFAASLAAPAFADASVGPLVISEAWARATPPGARVGGGYLTVKNTGAEPDTLISVASPVSEKTELHLMKTEDGVMTMRPADEGIEIPAGATLTLAPGGFHVMFIRPKSPFVQGQTVPLTLTFAKAGAVDVTLAIAPIGSAGPAPAGEPSMHNMNHDGAAK